MTSTVDERRSLKQRIEEALREVIDPELGIDIVSLGLVYDIDVEEGGRASVRMTMTSPSCPMGEQLALEAQACVESVEGVSHADVSLTWDPPWTPDRMTPEARSALGWGG